MNNQLSWKMIDNKMTVYPQEEQALDHTVQYSIWLNMARCKTRYTFSMHDIL